MANDDIDATDAWLRAQRDRVGERQLNANGWHEMRGHGDRDAVVDVGADDVKEQQNG